MKSVPFVLAALASAALANTAPTVVIQSAAMRPGTTLMDVVFRVNDPDDATVKTRALAFVGGVRSFAKVIRPVTFAEGTAAKLGDAIPTNVNHTLTWDVAADWDVDLGQVKFEVLAMDGRGLLPIDWITIPAAGGKPELTISKDTPPDAAVLTALFWQYASGDLGLALTNGVLNGSADSGNFSGITVASGNSIQYYGVPYLLKQMNLDAASSPEVSYAAGPARAGLFGIGSWHAANRNYAGLSVLMVWGNNTYGLTTIPPGLTGVTAIATAWEHSLALKSDGTVVGWGNNEFGQTTIPTGLDGVIALAAGDQHSLALKNDGTVVAWGRNNFGQTGVPPALTGVTAIAAGGYTGLALKGDGTVVGWGRNDWGETTIPAGITGVTAVAASGSHSLALKNDGTITGWGNNNHGQTTSPVGLTGVTAIAAGSGFSLALKNNGTVVAWGFNSLGQTSIPAGLTGVIAIAATTNHCLALKNDGTITGWGDNTYGVSTIPPGFTGGTAIAAGKSHSLTLKATAP